MNISNSGPQILHFLDLHFRPYYYFHLCLEWMDIWNLACGVLPRGRGQHILFLFMHWMNESRPDGVADNTDWHWPGAKDFQESQKPVVFLVFSAFFAQKRVRGGQPIFLFLPPTNMNICSWGPDSEYIFNREHHIFIYFYASNEWISGAWPALNPGVANLYPND